MRITTYRRLRSHAGFCGLRATASPNPFTVIAVVVKVVLAAHTTHRSTPQNGCDTSEV